MLVRRPHPDEHESVKDLVQAVVDEVYGGLWDQPPLPIGDSNWFRSWIAVSDTDIVGVALTSKNWLDDLWVNSSYRGRGVGRRLLQQAESEIKQRGFDFGGLRVVLSNANAISFYKHSGWRAEREFPHETFPVRMLEMKKQLNVMVVGFDVYPEHDE